MKFKIILLISSFFVYLNISSQFSIKTEYFYLKLINEQQKKVLIEDNLKNTEQTVSKLTANIDIPNNYSALFLTELVNSYSFLENNELAFFYNLYQRCLLPNDSLAKYQENSFRELAYSINLNDSLSSFFWKNTKRNNIPKNINDRITLLLKLSTTLYIDKLTVPIYKLGMQLRKNNIVPPIWYQNWEYLTIIGFKEKKKAKLISTSLNKSINQQVKGKNKYKIYTKAIRHYTKNNSLKHAEELIYQYKKEDISFFRKFGIIFKKTRIKICKLR